MTVTDNVNRFVLGLEKEDFELFEDGVKQNVTLFSDEDTPLSVGLVFDKSGSMANKLGASRNAATQLLSALNKDDEAFLVEFADLVNVSIPFTGHMEELRGVSRILRPEGRPRCLTASTPDYSR